MYKLSLYTVKTTAIDFEVDCLLSGPMCCAYTNLRTSCCKQRVCKNCCRTPTCPFCRKECRLVPGFTCPRCNEDVAPDLAALHHKLCDNSAAECKCGAQVLNCQNHHCEEVDRYYLDVERHRQGCVEELEVTRRDMETLRSDYSNLVNTLNQRIAALHRAQRVLRSDRPRPTFPRGVELEMPTLNLNEDPEESVETVELE